MTRNQSKERGATMVEFAVVAFVVFLFVNATVSMNVVLLRYGLMSHGTAQRAREIAANLAQNDTLSCNRINEVSRNMLTPEWISETYGVAGNFEVQSNFVPGHNEGAVRLPPRIELTTSMTVGHVPLLNNEGVKVQSVVTAAVDSDKLEMKCCHAACDCERFNCS